MAKRNKCEKCDWLKTSVKKYPWKCQVCEDVFPCKQKDCQHLDCQMERARACHICGGRIQSTSTYYFLDGKGIDGYAVHKSCAGEDYAYCVTVEELESEQ